MMRPPFFALGLRPDQVDPFVATIQQQDPNARVDRTPNLRGRIVRINGVKASEVALSPEIQWAVRGDRYISYTRQLKNNDQLTAGTPWPAGLSGGNHSFRWRKTLVTALALRSAIH